VMLLPGPDIQLDTVAPEPQRAEELQTQPAAVGNRPSYITSAAGTGR
jgi:hypothetical protein